MTVDEVEDLIDQYLQIREAAPVPEEELAKIEARLDIVLPADLRQISRVYWGEDLGERGHYEIAAGGPSFNITDKTLELRQSIGLPHRYVVLDEPPESLIVMETQASPDLPAPVTWLDAFDAERLVTGEPLIGSPDIYASYAAFFSAMLAAEVDMNAEQPARTPEAE